MLDQLDVVIWKTKSWDDIRIVFVEQLKEDRSPRLLDYVKYRFEVRNQDDIVMWMFEIDQNTKPDGSILFDEWEVDTESYGYGRQWIISQVYCFMNKIIYDEYQDVLYSDRTSISAKMAGMRQRLVDQWKAESLGYNDMPWTRFDSKPGPTPMFRMLPPT